jgi:hypothetical protein
VEDASTGGAGVTRAQAHGNHDFALMEEKIYVRVA